MKVGPKSNDFPMIDINEEEFKNESITPENLKKGFDLYLENGCLLIKNVFQNEYIKELSDFYFEEYKGYFLDQEFNNALTVGDKRRMITIDIKGPFNTHKLFANPLIFSLLEILLSKKIIIGAVTSVTSLPGARDQHVHRDIPHIFDEPDIYEGADAVIPLLPPYGITLIVPLIPLNSVNGTTRMFLGSHLVMRRNIRRKCKYIDPIVNIGDCMLMDCRLMHGGSANQSLNVRPVIYLDYFRHWYKDISANFIKQKNIQISSDEYNNIPERYQYLFNGLK